MSGRTKRSLRWLRGLIGALILAGSFYLLLIDTLDLPELYTGAGVVVLAAALFGASRDPEPTEIAPRALWWLRGWRVLARVPGDIAGVSFAALDQVVRRRPSYGGLRAVSFAGDRNPRTAAGRRALAEALGSLTPNTIVLGVDVERGLILAHELRPGHGRRSIDVLGLG